MPAGTLGADTWGRHMEQTHGGTDLLCSCAPGDGIRGLMECQQECIPLSCDLIPIVLPQLGPDDMVMHIYGLVHHLPVLCRCTIWVQVIIRVQVTIGRRWKLNAGQKWVQVYILGAGHNWTQVETECRSEFGAGVQFGCRSQFGAHENWIRVRIGCRCTTWAGHNWAQVKTECRSELGAGEQVGCRSQLDAGEN